MVRCQKGGDASMSQLVSLLFAPTQLDREPGHRSITSQVLANPVDRIRLDGAPLRVHENGAPRNAPAPPRRAPVPAHRPAHTRAARRARTEDSEALHLLLPAQQARRARQEGTSSPRVGQSSPRSGRRVGRARRRHHQGTQVTSLVARAHIHCSRRLTGFMHLATFAGPSSKCRNRVPTMCNSTDSAQSAERT